MSRKILFLATAVFASLAIGVNASTILVNPVSTSVAGPYTYTSFQAGYFFQANASGTAQVNQLGYEDKAGTGLSSAHDIGVYHWNGSAYELISKATVPAGTAATLEGGYRWVGIAPITLSDTSIGDYYAIVASYDGIDPTYEGANSVTNTIAGLSLASVTGNGFAVGAPLGAIGSTATGGVVNYQWGGANMGYVVPEPSSLVLLGMGALMMVPAMRNRLRRTV